MTLAGYAGGVSRECPASVIECGHKLCHAEATEGVIVMDPWAKCIFTGRTPRPERRYVLCDVHYASYFPGGDGWLSRENSVRLRVQCAVAGSSVEWEDEFRDRT